MAKDTQNALPQLDERLKHIAFIMDGNGRWAKARGLSRSEGHKEGAKNLKKVLEDVIDTAIAD